MRDLSESPHRDDIRAWRKPEMFHTERFHVSATSIEDAYNTLEILHLFDNFIAPSIPVSKPENMAGIEIYDGEKWVEFKRYIIPMVADHSS